MVSRWVVQLGHTVRITGGCVWSLDVFPVVGGFPLRPRVSFCSPKTVHLGEMMTVSCVCVHPAMIWQLVQLVSFP